MRSVDNINLDSKIKTELEQEKRKKTLYRLLNEGGVHDSKKDKFNILIAPIYENEINDNDFNAIMTMAKYAEKSIFDKKLTDDKLELLKFFDIDNDGTFSDKELNFLKFNCSYWNMEKLTENMKAADKNQNGVLDKDELEPILLKNSTFASASRLYMSSNDMKALFDIIGDDKVLLEKCLLAQDDSGLTILHKGDGEIAKLVFDKIGDDEKLLEKVLFARDKSQSIPLHSVDAEATKVILNRIKGNIDLYTKCLLDKNEWGKNCLHTVFTDKIKAITDNVRDDNLLEKLLLAKTNSGQTPLHHNSVDAAKIVLDRIKKNHKLLEKVLLVQNNQYQFFYNLENKDMKNLIINTIQESRSENIKLLIQQKKENNF